MNNQPILTRRNFVSGTALLTGVAALPSVLRAQAAPDAKTYHFNEQIQPVWTKAPLAPGEPGKDYKPTITLNWRHAAISRGRWREGVPPHLRGS